MSTHGQLMPEKMKELTPIFQARLSNDVTRQAALRALTLIANKASVDLSAFASVKCLEEVSGFMRKNSKDLRLATATFLEAMVRARGKKISTDGYALLIKETSPHIRYAYFIFKPRL